MGGYRRGRGAVVRRRRLLVRHRHRLLHLLWPGQRSIFYNVTLHLHHRPLSRCLDRCDRMIQNESRDPNGGNVCLFSAATSQNDAQNR